MTLEERIRAELKEALRQDNKVKRSILRLVLAGTKNAEIAQQKPLDDAGVLSVISREVKQHRESIEAFKQGKRSDLVAQEESELAVLLEYLPQQLSREEIMAVARKVIEETGAKGQGDKGKVMSQLMPQLKGKADGREVSSIVSELLS